MSLNPLFLCAKFVFDSWFN